MSWFKKLFHFFKSEEDEYIDEHVPTKNEGNREVDAKVIYQYPKGQFRFPLIPDEDRKDVRKGDGKRNVNRKSPAEGTTSRRDVRRNLATENTERTRVNRVQVQKKSTPSNRPFRPTEIPSPIYGFEKHPKRTAPVEFELEGFSAPERTEAGAITAKPEEVKKEARESIEISNSAPIVENEEVAHQQKQEVSAKLEETVDINTAILKKEISIQEKVQQFADHELAQQSELSSSSIDEENEELSYPEEVELDEKFAEEAIEGETEEAIEVAIEGKTEKEIEEAIEEEDSRKVAEASEPTRRSHLPFNVIMLKEDKRKLAERAAIAEEVVSPIREVSASVEQEILEKEDIDEEYYVFPSFELLKPPVFKNIDREWLELQEQQLNETLFHFNVRASVANVTQGPSVTRFEVHPEPGVKVNKITNLADDIKLSLAAKDIRMEAPIPGTHMIGVEVPNETSRPVFISEIIGSDEFAASTSPLTAVLGLDISGKPIVTDLRKMPHGLIAGATGSGKSVCINSILVSLLYKANPNEVKLLLIDPKMVELAPYNQIPHLVSPVITDVKAATAALKWAVEEMERRYELFAHAGVRDITRFNELAEEEQNYAVKLPYIVIIIDELADLMMMSPADVEEAICRIAQKARACGIHLIIATQRPSVDVITGLIKANVPTRIAFSVSSQIDSRTIIDISGAERLLGRGDMLFLENGSSKPVRLQGTYVSDAEIDSIVAHVRREQKPQYLFEQEELLRKAVVTEEEDELFYEACEFIVEQGGASTSSLQRKFKIGYNRAARLIDMMEEQGFISEARGSKPRDVLITESELELLQEE